jgi:hypothetical protein
MRTLALNTHIFVSKHQNQLLNRKKVLPEPHSFFLLELQHFSTMALNTYKVAKKILNIDPLKKVVLLTSPLFFMVQIITWPKLWPPLSISFQTKTLKSTLERKSGANSSIPFSSWLTLQLVEIVTLAIYIV